MNDHSSEKQGGGFKSGTDAYLTLPVPTFSHGAITGTPLICICRYTCTLHCIVILVLLCKDFYCYLLEVSLSQTPLFFHGQAAWRWRKLLRFSVIFYFSSFFFPPEHQFSSKENVFIHVRPIILNCKLQKYLFKKLRSCFWRFSGTSLISWLESLLLKL